MSPIGASIGRRFAALLDELCDLAKHEPSEADAITIALVAHLRSWRPEAVAPLGTLPPPSTTIADPRNPT